MEIKNCDKIVDIFFFVCVVYLYKILCIVVRPPASYQIIIIYVKIHLRYRHDIRWYIKKSQ